MKTVVIIFAAICGVFVAACVTAAGLLLLAQGTGDQRQEAFFASVASGDPEEVLALCHPEMRQKVDAPVLAAWMDAFNESHGEFLQLSLSDFRTQTKLTAEGQLTTSEGTVDFAHGPARSRLVQLDGQIVEWKVDSQLLGNDWFRGPKTNDLYAARGEAFLRHFLEQDADAAYALTHPALREVLSEERFRAMISTVAAEEGALKSIELDQAELDLTDGQWLAVYYLIETEASTFRSKVKFQFEGLQGHLLAFELDADPSVP